VAGLLAENIGHIGHGDAPEQVVLVIERDLWLGRTDARRLHIGLEDGFDVTFSAKVESLE
jgi:hypothetical protein